MTGSTRESSRRLAQRLVTPLFGVAFGLLMFAIFALQGDWFTAVTSLVIMAAYSAGLLVMGRRSDTVALLGGDAPDERGEAITLRALAFTGGVLVVLILALFVWEVAHGRTGKPWTPMGAIAGVSFLSSTIWHARRT